VEAPAPVVEAVAASKEALSRDAVLQHRALLGTVPDEDIAAMVGYGRHTVGAIRRELGIRPYTGHYERAREAARAKAAETAAAKPAPVVEAPKAEAPKPARKPKVAAEVAAPAAPAPAAPAPAAPVEAAKPATAPGIVPIPGKLAGFEHLLGVESDSVVARKAGCSPRWVRTMRGLRNIPPAPRAPSGRKAKDVVAAPVAPSPVVAAKAAVPAAKAAAPVAAKPVAAAPVAAKVAAPVAAKPAAPAPVVAPAAKVAAPVAPAPVAAKVAAPVAPAPVAAKVASPVAPAPVAAPVAAAVVVSAPVVAAVVSSAPKRGFAIVAEAGGQQHRFLVLATDIVSAATRAVDLFSRRAGGPWTIARIAAGPEVVE
jgi:hypothetical protein